MKIKSFIAASLLFLLASCGPPQPYFQTSYQLIAPNSDNGRMCANNCLMMQQNCRSSCSIQSQQCQINNTILQQNARYQADRDFDDYVRDRQAMGRLIKRDRNDFYNEPLNNCGDESCSGSCTNDYYGCYTNCGGQVIPQTSCVSNCHLVGPGQVTQ